MRILGLIRNKIRVQIWAAFSFLIVLFLLVSYKIYSDLVELGVIASAINELDNVAVNIQYMAHDDNAYLLGHTEHADEFKQHAARLIWYWDNFKRHREDHGGVDDREQSLFHTIESSVGAFIDNSQKLFTIFDESRKQHEIVIDQTERLAALLVGAPVALPPEAMRGILLLFAAADPDSLKHGLEAPNGRQDFLASVRNLEPMIATGDIDNATRSTLVTLIDAMAKRRLILTDVNTARLAADENGDTIDGAVAEYVAIYLDEIAAFKVSARNSSIVAAVIMLIGGVLMALRVGQTVSGPVVKLVAAADKFENGNFEHRALVDASNELSVVANAFNAMADRVQAFNRNLERQVRERTVELAESRDRTEAIMGRIIDGIAVCGDDGVIESTNAAVERILGVGENYLTGKPMETLFATVSGPAVIGPEIDPRALAESGQFVELNRQDGNGGTVWLEAAASTLRLGREEILIIVFRDITERKKIEQTKNEFVSTVSHELRTPLTSIKGSLGLIRSGSIAPLPDQLKPMADIAYSNSNRLVLLINDILDMEKIAAGKMDFHMTPVEVVSLVRDAIAANKGFGDEHNVTFVLTTTEKEALVQGDKDRLMQVLSNLMSNAAKFSPDGEQVNLSITSNDGIIRIAVQDKGPGIPEEFRESIFEKFSQADSTDTRKKGGTGLGLSITRAIVEQHGGTVGFETEIGRGSLFFVDLPALADQSGGQSPETDRPGRRRILICEDEADIAAILETVLAKAGYATSTARTAAQAKQRLADGDYDAMTLDLGLPDQDGLSLLQELREKSRTRDLPIIVISATAKEGRQELNGSALGVIDWIEKPIDTPHLMDRIDVALKQATGARPRILHVEDDQGIQLVVSALVADTADVVAATTVGQAGDLLERETFDLVILDLTLPDGGGEAILPLLNRPGDPSTPVIIFSADEISRETADSIKAALIKSQVTNETLLNTIRLAIEAGRTTG